jgi:acetyl esterase/lipase
MTTVSAIDIRKNVPFGAHDGNVLTGDYYAPPEAGAYPALIALHGGAWKYGTAEGYQYWGPYLAQHGYVLFAINYRLIQGTKHRYPVAVHDTRAAVQFLRSQSAALKVDPTRIGCMGDSAGAHLAALVALAGDTPPFCVAGASEAYAGVSTHEFITLSFWYDAPLTSRYSDNSPGKPRHDILATSVHLSRMALI